MEVARHTLELIYTEIVGSVGYKTTVGPIDKGKVTKRLAGTATPLPRANLALAAWRTAALLTPLAPPPPPPPPPYVKVAPRVAYKTDRGDARYCMFEADGSLRPGISRRPDDYYTDESGAVYSKDGDGLEESAVRSPAPAVTASDEIDGRPYCSLPLEGDPTKNTGSWTI